MTRKSMKQKSKDKGTNRTLSAPILILMVFGALLLVGAGFLLLPKDEVDPNYDPEVSSGPSLQADKEQIDFGDVRFNEFVVAEFELTNVGDETLRFTQDPYVELKDGC